MYVCNVFLVISINYHPINLYLTILKIFIIMHFLAVVLKIRSNSIQILTRISVEVRTGKEKSYGSILHIVAMFPPTLVKVF